MLTYIWLQETYAANQREVFSLFLDDQSRCNILKALAKQLSLYITASSDPPLMKVRGKVEVGSGYNHSLSEEIHANTVDVVMKLAVCPVNEDEVFVLILFSPEQDWPEQECPSNALKDVMSAADSGDDADDKQFRDEELNDGDLLTRFLDNYDDGAIFFPI